MDPHRTERLAEALREELAELIAYEMSDPRVLDVMVTEVITSPDKRLAHVRIGLTSGEDPKEALNALEHARGFLRRQLSQRLVTYRIPELRFEANVLPGLGGRMETLLKRVRKGRPREATEPAVESASSSIPSRERQQADPKK